MENQCE